MAPVDFAHKYERDDFAIKRLTPELEQLLAPADEWGRRFGQTLYDHLDTGSDEPDDSGGEPFLFDYGTWTGTGLYNATRAILDGTHSNDDRTEANGRLNFHRLNACMGLQWLLESMREKPDGRLRSEIITYSQDMLAFDAVRAYIDRERSAGIKSGFAYFGADNVDNRANLEGILNEYDAAITLLEISRKHDLTILPAPPQFERSHNSSRNVDFLAIGPGKETVGIQVKTNVDETVVRKYDDDIVLVDARVDLGNHMARRTAMHSSSLKHVGWAGIITAQRVQRISTKNRSIVMQNKPHLRRSILTSQMQARELVRGMSDELPKAAMRIGQRLLPRFVSIA